MVPPSAAGERGARARRVDPENPTVITTFTNPYPSHKFCPMTGLPREYAEPKSGTPYASLRALEQIRECHHPWMNAGNSGTTGYWEVAKGLRDGT